MTARRVCVEKKDGGLRTEAAIGPAAIIASRLRSAHLSADHMTVVILNLPSK